MILAFAEGPARAADNDIEAYVMTIDGADVIVDLGVKQGASVGDVVELWRPLKLKHPVTGKIVTDRFRIGSLKLTQVRDKLSLARPDSALAKSVEPGDIVILHGVAPPPKPVPTTPTPTTPTTPTTPVVPAPTAPTVDVDPEARALSNLFDELRGAPIEVRIARYESFAKSWSKGRFATVLREEAAALRKLQAAPESAGTEPTRPVSLGFDAPENTVTGTPLVMAVEITGDLKGAVLQLRGADETTFQPLPMTPAGPRYYRVTLPAARVRAPSLAYFVEAVLPDGSTVAVVGSASDPRTVKVVDAPRVPPAPGWKSVAAVWTDWADYNRLRGNDRAWQTEGFFGMRFRDVGLRSVRSGFGVYKGQGGSLRELDSSNPLERRAPRTVGLSYGYVEGEWGVTHFWGIVGRAIVGLSEDGVTGGAQGFVRIGNDRRTNMLLGGEVLGGVGLRGIAQLELNTFPRFPIMFRSEVTNQPAGASPSASRRRLDGAGVAAETGDIGVRAILQLGYRPVAGFTLFVRGSYQGRTINHAGPGVGGGAQVEW